LTSEGRFLATTKVFSKFFLKIFRLTVGI
jgi:hypothetical protein